MLEYFEDVMNSSSTRNGKKVSDVVQNSTLMKTNEFNTVNGHPFGNEEKERSNICCEGQFNII